MPLQYKSRQDLTGDLVRQDRGALAEAMQQLFGKASRPAVRLARVVRSGEQYGRDATILIYEADFGDELKRAYFKADWWGSAVRETVAASIARELGANSYGSLAGRDFTLSEEVPGQTMWELLGTAGSFARQIGSQVPFSLVLANSDINEGNVVIGDGRATTIDYGACFDYSNSDRWTNPKGGLMLKANYGRGLAIGDYSYLDNPAATKLFRPDRIVLTPEQGADFAEGLREGKAMILGRGKIPALLDEAEGELARMEFTGTAFYNGKNPIKPRYLEYVGELLASWEAAAQPP